MVLMVRKKWWVGLIKVVVRDPLGLSASV